MTPNLVPTILVRKHVILATVLHIRCLVKADQVIIFDTVGTKDSKLQSGFIAHLTVSTCWTTNRRVFRELERRERYDG